MPAPQPITQAPSRRGISRVARRPSRYSGMRTSFCALPAPNEKDATPRAYRGVASLILDWGLLSERPERHIDGGRLAVTHVGEGRVAAGGRRAHLRREVDLVGDRHAVELGHDVALAQPGARRRRRPR